MALPTKSVPTLDANDLLLTKFLPTVIATNLIPNPVALNDVNMMTHYAGAGGVGFRSRIVGATPVSNTFTRFAWTTAPTTANAVIKYSQSGASNYFGLSPNTVYTFSAWVRYTQAGKFRAIIERWDGVNGGTNLSNINGTSIDVPANTWTRIPITFTTDANAGVGTFYGMTVGQMSSGVPAVTLADTFDTVGGLLTQTSYLLPYFDGTFSGCRWTGAAGASTSERRMVRSDDETDVRTRLDATTPAAKGELIVGSGSSSPSRLAVGANGRQLFADSTQAAGLRWANAGELPLSGFISAGSDLNTALAPGSYVVNNSATNIPSPVTGFLTVSVQNVNVLQEFRTVGTIMRFFSRRSIDSGTTWTAWTEFRTDSPLAGNTITGTGGPNGVVAAPVGTIYVDTAAITGAVIWIKVTGTGNTGWFVDYGDTGWRNISSLLTNGWTGTLKVRRMGKFVSLNADSLNGTTATSSTVCTIPDGFKTAGLGGYWRGALQQLNGATITYYRAENCNPNLVLGGISIPFASNLYGQNDYTTVDAWPTVLPGTVV